MTLAIYGQNYSQRTVQEREKVLSEDWSVDSEGHTHLDYMRFTFCWFQIADRWKKSLFEP
jgi:hypothetical protein